MNKLHKIINKKYQLYKNYCKGITSKNIKMKEVPITTTSPVHWFSNVVCEDAENLQNYLKGFDIPSRRIFLPLNNQPCLKNNNNVLNDNKYFEKSEKAFRSILSLPSSILMNQEQLNYIIEKINQY